MSTMGQTGLEDCKEATKNLVVANGRAANRPDKDERRNALTSIYWVPTKKDPNLLMAENCSDHVHYYQGGLPFRYYLFDPSTGEFSTVVLGPELHKGQKLQVPVKGGIWKCGSIEQEEDADDNKSDYEYTIIGEAVAPGFDFHDFKWVTKEMLDASCNDETAHKRLASFVHKESSVIAGENKTVETAAEFYEDGTNKTQRTNDRA
ncbi:unnamed protein product [Cylindrotheca closterium]|uniref:DUF985 domain-containing protein n=1 Tax=Cylindrotheca closterium TaxID=2856 RepID=A0AAD2FQR2_9STRA|nr:unnamed protein product [Cylindrotheca closterium]